MTNAPRSSSPSSRSPVPARTGRSRRRRARSEEHTSELQSRSDLVCRLLLEKKKKKIASVDNANKGLAHLQAKAIPVEGPKLSRNYRTANTRTSARHALLDPPTSHVTPCGQY